MPAPILQIPIDDKDFQGFLATFKKYQDQLKDQPAEWAGIGSSIRDTVEIANDFADALQGQLSSIEAITRAEEERERKREDSSRRQRKDRDEDSRHEEQQANRRRVALDQVREFSRNIGDVARKGGGAAANAAEGLFGAIGGGAAGLFGAAGGVMKGIPVVGGVLGGAALAGYEVMANMNSARQSAHGLGVSVQTLQGWQTALGPYLPAGSAEHLLSTVSEAQATPGGGGLFSRFGIKNAGNRDVSDVSAEMLMHAQKYLKDHPGQAGLWGAKGQFGNAIDTGTLRTLQTMSPKELKDQLDAAKKFAKDNAEAEKTSADLTKSLSRAEQTATTTVDHFGTAVAGAADQLTDSFKRLFNVIEGENSRSGGVDAKPWHDAPKSVSGYYNKAVGNVGADAEQKWGRIKERVWGALTSGYDAVVGHVMNIPGGASAHTLGELAQYNSMIRSGARSAGLGNSSALGQYQIVGTTRERVGRTLWGKDWKNQKFDAQHQEQMARYIWEHDARHGNAHAVFASLPDSRRGAYSDYSFDQIRGRLARGEGGMPHSDTGHVARAVGEAVKKGVIAAHSKLHSGSTPVKIKVQQKPGSDVTVAARQLAGR